jgi:hypothetical protein
MAAGALHLPHRAPASSVLAHTSRWTFTVLESSLLARHNVQLSNAPKIASLVPLALTLRPDLVVLDWPHGARPALERLQEHPATRALRVAIVAPPLVVAGRRFPPDLLILPAHEVTEWDALLGQWLAVPHRHEERRTVMLRGGARNPVASEYQPAVIVDLSRSGALVRTDDALPLKGAVALRFTVGAHPVECLGVVRRHVREAAGHYHGVQFVEIAAHHTFAIAEYLRTLTSGRETGLP